ncbi:peptidase MA family metallohydrolase [Thermosyntropha sp.]|uniref:peptidase MA family metallohydrolase n=1 Tax=Thermosyntropha sp. TaxID=2740820 RepID=UPI0025E48FBE|nr:peptidase MA family metallohydrolase [Thermosyntropha sp.]MBO8159638.1 hypothetical protein [Thermosyntropha sp.]
MISFLKPFAGGKYSLIIVFLLLTAILIWGVRNNQFILRVAVNQEIALKTHDFKEIQTEHYTIKYAEKSEGSINLIVESAEEAYDKVCAWFGREPSYKATIIVYPDAVSLAESFGWDKDEKAMGVYWAGSIRVLSPEVWLGHEEMEERFKKEGPMVHEFAHLMVDEITNGNYNRWFTEGIAQYVEKKITGFEFSSPFKKGDKARYYKLSELSRDFDGLKQDIAYYQSLKIVDYIAYNYGEEGIFRILQKLGKGYNLNRAIEESLGVKYQEFEQKIYQELLKN